MLSSTITAPERVAATPRSAPGKRLFDLFLTAIGFFLLMPIFLIVAAVVKLTSKGPVFYWSDRVGIDNKIFRMPKFRTMQVGTPQLATHVMAGSAVRYLTPVGSFLRRTSLDELPQLLSVLRGDMSLVGPRPALFNQDDLIALRTEAGVHRISPGVTGWAQVNGRDELPIPVKVRFDSEYLRRRSVGFDLKIIWMTLTKVARSEGITH